MRWREHKAVTDMLQWILLAAMALTGAAGCTTDAGQAPPPASAPQHVEDSNGARFKVTMNGQEFTRDDELRVEVEILNVTQQPIAYNGLNGCDDGIRVYVSTDGIKQKFVEKRPENAGEPKLCHQAITNKQLDPGQSVKKSVTLLPAVEKTSGEIEPVPPGRYELRAELTRIRENDEKIGVNLPITIKEK